MAAVLSSEILGVRYSIVAFESNVELSILFVDPTISLGVDDLVINMFEEELETKFVLG